MLGAGSHQGGSQAVAGSRVGGAEGGAVAGQPAPVGTTGNAFWAPEFDTAQLPVVGAPRGGRSAPVRGPERAAWAPGAAPRLPAPFLLRLGVWLLFAALLVALAGLAVEHVHPTWLDFARKTQPSLVSVPGAPTTTQGPTTPKGTTPGGFHEVSSSASGSVYATGTSSYALVLTFAHPVWTIVASPAGSQKFLVEQTLQPSASPKTVQVSGSASVILSASTESLAVTSGGKTLGTIPSPRASAKYTYTFRP